ncbi:unnamed protein product [Chrysoparadoxa australica]
MFRCAALLYTFSRQEGMRAMLKEGYNISNIVLRLFRTGIPHIQSYALNTFFNLAKEPSFVDGLSIGGELKEVVMACLLKTRSSHIKEMSTELLFFLMAHSNIRVDMLESLGLWAMVQISKNSGSIVSMRISLLAAHNLACDLDKYGTYLDTNIFETVSNFDDDVLMTPAWAALLFLMSTALHKFSKLMITERIAIELKGKLDGLKMVTWLRKAEVDALATERKQLKEENVGMVFDSVGRRWRPSYVRLYLLPALGTIYNLCCSSTQAMAMVVKQGTVASMGTLLLQCHSKEIDVDGRVYLLCAAMLALCSEGQHCYALLEEDEALPVLCRCVDSTELGIAVNCLWALLNLSPPAVASAHGAKWTVIIAVLAQKERLVKRIQSMLCRWAHLPTPQVAFLQEIAIQLVYNMFGEPSTVRDLLSQGALLLLAECWECTKSAPDLVKPLKVALLHVIASVVPVMSNCGEDADVVWRGSLALLECLVDSSDLGGLELCSEMLHIVCSHKTMAPAAVHDHKMEVILLRLQVVKSDAAVVEWFRKCLHELILLSTRHTIPLGILDITDSFYTDQVTPDAKGFGHRGTASAQGEDKTQRSQPLTGQELRHAKRLIFRVCNPSVPQPSASSTEDALQSKEGTRVALSRKAAEAVSVSRALIGRIRKQVAALMDLHVIREPSRNPDGTWGKWDCSAEMLRNCKEGPIVNDPKWKHISKKMNLCTTRFKAEPQELDECTASGPKIDGSTPQDVRTFSIPAQGPGLTKAVLCPLNVFEGRSHPTEDEAEGLAATGQNKGVLGDSSRSNSSSGRIFRLSTIHRGGKGGRGSKGSRITASQALKFRGGGESLKDEVGALGITNDRGSFIYRKAEKARSGRHLGSERTLTMALSIGEV